MEEEKFNQQSNNFTITVPVLQEMVNKWMQREHGSDDIDYLEENGGYTWLERGLQTSFQNGINTSSIKEREAHFGSNRKEKVEIKSIFELMLDAFQDLILRILFIAGIASIVINMITEEDHRNIAWIEGFAILLSVAIVVTVTAWNDLKKEREFQKLNDQAESGKKVSVIRDGQENDELKIGDIQVGDLIILKSGIEIPGDGIIVQGYSVQIDESSMTGETKPMNKESFENCLKKKAELEKKGIEKLDHHAIPSVVMMAGTKVLAGSGKMVVINVGKNSSIGKIQEILTSGEDELTPLQLKLEKIARDIGWFGLASALIIFIVLLIMLLVEGGRDNWKEGTGFYVRSIFQYFLISITILVVAIPEGLPLAVTLSLAFSVNKMMEDQNLVRRLQACETMGGANIICSDKTGTLTKNQMEVTNLWNGKEMIVYDDSNATLIKYTQFIPKEETRAIFLNTLIYNSTEDPKKKEGNPTEMAMLKYLQKCGVDVVDYRNKGNKLYEASFSSDRKRMSSVIKLSDGKHYVFMKGASEYMLEISDKFLEFETGQFLNMSFDLKSQMQQTIQHMATQALRTIGICYKEVNYEMLDFENKDERGIYSYEKDGFTVIGIFGIRDTIREEVPDSIAKCHQAGIDVKMVTGDNKITARAIAKNVGIITDKNESTALVMEGPDFLRKIGGVVCDNCRAKEKCDCVNNEKEKMLPENKKKQIRKDTIKYQEEFDKIWKNLCVLARSRPEDKYALVIGLKERGNVVAVTGDGTNDAPALSKADVGFAMGIAGTEVAKQAADIMIMDDNFASIIKAVKWGRNIYDSIRKFIQFQLTVNVVAVLTTFVSAVIIREAIFSAVQMLWINLIMDTLAALALATEPPSDLLLKRKPHGRKDYIISPIMMKHILGQAIFQCTVIFIFVFAGDKFLFDYMGRRQLQPGKDIIVTGIARWGYLYRTHGDFPVHFAYNFNLFVFLQFFNFLNARILDDSFNVFVNITKSSYFLIILLIIFILQIIFLTFCGPAIRIVWWGLDPLSWLFTIIIGSLGLIWSVILKLIPLEKILPGGGQKELNLHDLNKASTLNIKKGHDSQFYKQQSGMIKGSGIIEDKNIN